MYRIIGSRGIGKTAKMLEQADRLGAIIVCSNPLAMRQKARALGFENIKDFIEFNEVIHQYFDKPVFIDDIEKFARSLTHNLNGYTYTIDENEN